MSKKKVAQTKNITMNLNKTNIAYGENLWISTERKKKKLLLQISLVAYCNSTTL